MKNKVHIDYANNAELAEYFSQKRAGDKCTIEVTLQLDNVTDKTATGTIEKVAYEEKHGGEEKEAEPTPEKPMMMEMKVGRGKGKKRESDEDDGMGY